jgi:transposase-like protein
VGRVDGRDDGASRPDYAAIAAPLRSSATATRYGCIFGPRWACAWSRRCWPPAASISERLAVATNGTWMWSSSASPGKHWLWRAVDQDGFVLDVLVQSRRDKKAAKRLFRKLLKKQGRTPRVLVIDKLKSYAAAKREIMPGASTARTRASITWVENSNQPTRRRERIMKRFKSPRHVQRFFSTHDQLANLFPAAETTTPPTSGRAAPRPSPPGPMSPALRLA